MKSKLQKLNEVYKYLRSIGKTHTQREFAEQLKTTKTGLSSAFSGNERYLTANLFKKIYIAYPDIFNKNYLLGDDDNMLKNNQHIDKISNNTGIAGIDVHHNKITNNGNGLTKDEVIIMMNERFTYLQKKELEIKNLIKIIEDKEQQINFFSEENKKLTSELIKRQERIDYLTDKLLKSQS